jgi:hypothetical protein
MKNRFIKTLAGCSLWRAVMKKSNQDVGTTHGCLRLCLIVLILAGGCPTAPPESVTKFGQGLAVVNTDARRILLEFNKFVRDIQLDRAETLKNLQESDVAPGLDAESVSRWNAAMEAMSLYASALATLTDPGGTAGTEKSLKSLGNRIVALGPPRDAASSRGDELTRAVSHIGGLIVDRAARRKALEIAREADPSVRAVLLQMANMIGRDHTTGGLRTTIWSNWTIRANQIRVDFLAPGAKKRKVAAMYATAIENRQTSDIALGTLRMALLNLADLHTAVAQGRSADASEIILFMRQEVTYAKQLLKSAQVSESEGDI